MSTTTVTGTILDPSDNPIAGATVEAILASDQGAYLLDDSAEILSRTTTTTAANGTWSMALIPNAEITPTGTGYEITRLVDLAAEVDTINVPVSGSPVAFASILVDPSVTGGLAAGGVLAGTYPNPTFADADVTALAALGDGYPRRASSTWAARTAAQLASDLGVAAYFKTLAGSPDLLIAGVITRDGNEAATSAPVVWPDGTVGTYTATTVSTLFPGAVDAYTVTYGSPVTLTFTQSAVTRDTAGAVTTRPAMTVA